MPTIKLAGERSNPKQFPFFVFLTSQIQSNSNPYGINLKKKKKKNQERERERDGKKSRGDEGGHVLRGDSGAVDGVGVLRDRVQQSHRARPRAPGLRLLPGRQLPPAPPRLSRPSLRQHLRLPPPLHHHFLLRGFHFGQSVDREWAEQDVGALSAVRGQLAVGVRGLGLLVRLLCVRSVGHAALPTLQRLDPTHPPPSPHTPHLLHPRPLPQCHHQLPYTHAHLRAALCLSTREESAADGGISQQQERNRESRVGSQLGRLLRGEARGSCPHSHQAHLRRSQVWQGRGAATGPVRNGGDELAQRLSWH